MNAHALKKLAEQPHDSSDIIHVLTEHCRFFLFSYSPELRSLLSWSSNSEAVLGVKDFAVARDGNLFLRHVHADDRFALLSDLEGALEGKHPYRATYRWIRPDTKEVRWLHCRGAITHSENGDLFEGSIIDISEEVTGPVSTIAGPDSINSILAALPRMVFTLDNDFRILRANREAKHSEEFHFGDPSFDYSLFRIGRDFLSCFGSTEQREYFRELFTHVLSGDEASRRTRIAVDTSVFSVEILPVLQEKVVAGALCIISDVSEVVSLEHDLAELKKKDGLQLLASGLAHNFNNALQSIMGQAAIIESRPEQTALVQEASQAIQKIVQQTSGLTHQLLAGESQQDDFLSSVDLNLTIMAAINRIEDLFTGGMKVAVAFGNPPAVLAREEALIDAIEALLRNAQEAMEEPGNLTLRTFSTELHDFEIEDLPAGLYARITVSDSGKGMSSLTRERCMEPFFTTKGKDEASGLALNGRGLGLSKTFRIIREFKGAIAIDSVQGHGTSVSVFLPSDGSQAAPKKDKTHLTAGASAPRVLIVDDDEMVARTAQTVLRDAGVEAAVAGHYRDALSTLRSSQDSLELVLVDALLPGMDGPSILRRLKRLKPDIKALGFSGAPPEQTRRLIEAGAFAVLEKPVSPAELRRAVLKEVSQKTSVKSKQ